MYFPKQRSPEMKSMAESGTAVLLWPRGQASAVHVLYGTRLSYTHHGDWDSIHHPKGLGMCLTPAAAPFMRCFLLSFPEPWSGRTEEPTD